MNLCSGSHYNIHDEICYEGRNCPFCEKINELNDVQSELDKAQRTIDNLESEKK